jgi:hypothetical protein
MLCAMEAASRETQCWVLVGEDDVVHRPGWLVDALAAAAAMGPGQDMLTLYNPHDLSAFEVLGTVRPGLELLRYRISSDFHGNLAVLASPARFGHFAAHGRANPALIGDAVPREACGAAGVWIHATSPSLVSHTGMHSTCGRRHDGRRTLGW